MELKYLKYEQSGKIGVVTLNRPEVRNALNMDLLLELNDTMHKLDWAEEISVLIVKGSGKGFSSGYDLDEIALRDELPPHRDIMRDSDVLHIYDGIRRCTIATIAQLHGFSLNGATDLCHQLDFTIVADDCLVGYPTMRCWGASVANMWLYHMGPQWSKYMMMTGDNISGAFAEKIGFALKSVPPERLEKTVMDFAERLANVDKKILAAHKRCINAGLDLMGCRLMLDYGAQSDCLTNTADIVQKTFDRTSGLGLESLLKEVNRGFKPQKAPFEPLDS
jgi:enoyl-CoA hydratase